MLELKNVCKSYEDFAVKNISFALPRYHEDILWGLSDQMVLGKVQRSK